MIQNISTSYSVLRGASSDTVAKEISALDDAVARGCFTVLRFDDKKMTALLTVRSAYVKFKS